MAERPLTIWCNYSFDENASELLRMGTAPHRLVATLDEAEVAFGQPDADRAATLNSLRWVHLSSAGYTSFDRPDVRAALAGRGAALTTSSFVYAEPCAQHLLAFLLADARQLPASMRHQLGDRGWPSTATRAASRLVRGQSVMIYGFGAIARRLVQLLAPFGPEVVGLRRRAGIGEAVPIFAAAGEEARAWLGRADHVMSTLPASDETRRFFDAARFADMRPGAVFYNVGRGGTVDQEALAAALTSGRLRAAYLDVTDPEPLPPDHPLWSIPNCVITPHTAGGHADEQQRLVVHFLANLRRYTAGEPLVDRII
jgi:phosphoglycerate dehydrogenase-like enzyme